MKRLKLLLIVASAAFSGCMSSTNLWQEGDRGTQFSIETDAQRVISVPLDPYNPLAGRFDLNYFIRHQKGDRPKKTVLYIAGGPGEFVEVSQGNLTPASFVTLNEYNQIYFHLRGAGRSQINPSNQYDKYVRTTYAVHDIEEIRQDLIRQDLMRPDGKWDAIIAWSYGTVLAQQYTSLHQSHVDKLILISPLSNHNLAASGEKRRTEARQIWRRTLENIYDAKQYPKLVSRNDPRVKEFFDLEPRDKLKILDTVFGSTDAYGTYTPGVIENVESAFGSLQFVMDNYDYLAKLGELKRYDLDRYRCSFFYSLHSLRLLGWIGDNLDNQTDAAKNIRDAILGNRTSASANDCVGNRPFSQRAFYSIGYRDGTNSRFVREYLANGRKEARDALRKSAGEAHEKRGVNEYVEKLGIDDDDEVEPWDPADYKHSRPTLILKGNADPIVVGDQAEHFLTDALLGPRILISFEGVGHELNLPNIKLAQAFHGTIALQKTRLPPINVREVIGTATGIAYNKILTLKLTPPNDLEDGLKVVGFGRALGASNSIKVLVNNTTSRVIQGSAKVWKINNDIFTGTTVLDIGTIESGETKELTGTLVPRGRGEKYQLELRPVAGWNSDLELQCFQESWPLLGGFWVAPLLSNKSDLPTTIPPLSRWTLGNEFFKHEFLWEDKNSASVPPQQATRADVFKPGIELPQYVVWQLKGPGNFEACIPNPLVPGSPLKLKVYYSGQQPDYSLSQAWKIENSIFAGTLTVQLASGMEDHKIRELPVTLDIVLGDWLKFGQPLASRKSIEVIGYNVLDERRISLLLKNPGKWEMNVGDEGKEWHYALNSGHSKSLQNTLCRALNDVDTRDCLIYAFLVMNPTQFSSQVDNPILGEVERVLTLEDNQLKPKVTPLGVDNP